MSRDKEREGRRGREGAPLDAFFDETLSPEERAAIERRLAEDPELSRRLAALRRVEGWLQETRPAPPRDLSEGILQTIREGSRRSVATRKGPSSAADWVRMRIRWAWAPAAAIAALLLILAWHDMEPRLRSHRAPELTAATESAESTPPSAPAPAATVPCRFRFEGKDARQVCLVGSFNLWKVCDTPLQRDPDGAWSVTLDLPPGRYEYMFVVDGEWQPDPMARQQIDDGFGRQNSVLLL